MMEIDNIDNIITALFVACKQEGIKPSDDMMLDCATRIWSTKFINASKGGQGGSSDTGATDKQKTAMTNMSLPFTDATTKDEAKALISAKIASFNN